MLTPARPETVKVLNTHLSTLSNLPWDLKPHHPQELPPCGVRSQYCGSSDLKGVSGNVDWGN